MPSTLPPLVRFANFEVDVRAGELRRDGNKVRLQEQPFLLLTVLLESAGEVVTREELRERLWAPDTFVDFDHRLAVAVSKLRDALRDSAEKPKFVATVGRRGYRFVGQLECIDSLFAAPNVQIVETLPPSSQPADQGDIPELTPREPARLGTGRLIFVASAAFVILLSVIALWKFVHIRSGKEQPLPTRSLAILPLQNHGQDSNSDFLGLSLADVLITKLAYVSSLSIRPSAAVEKYRGAAIDLQKVATDLKVDTLLTGSFIRDGDNLRITYQLVDAKTEKILGQGVIDLKYDNLLTVQDRVTNQLISELQLSLSPSEAERLKPEKPVNPLAYEYFLQGLDFHGQHKFPLAIKMLEKSTSIDPNYAPAWAYLGASYNSDAAFELGGREQYRRAEAAYERALALRPNLLDAQMFLANLLVDTGKVEQAVPLLRDALKTNRNNAAAHWELGYAYRFAGMLEESVAECKRARELAPLVKGNGSVLNTYLYLGRYREFLESLPVDDSSFTLFYRGFGEFHEKEFDQASKDFDRAYELDPTLYAGIGKALSDSIHQRKGEGLELLSDLERQIKERGVGDPEATYKIAEAYAVLGDKIAAMRVLRTSVESGFFSYPYIANDPLLKGLHKQPQFDAILSAARQRHEAFKSSLFS
ncbi:MAG: winged helix-turn-helix domain-containing protein [Acidobacteriaceae bacterium]|nr:winged helix-turn-helix domain-containing protein [Acidobacteriaceae bacterium]MBV9503049.1 winged helix-turn-helix domain-containing protein [Acidobacteriaceae bacterium]